MMKYGSREGLGLGTGIAPLPVPQSSHHPGYTPAPPSRLAGSLHELGTVRGGRGAHIRSSTHFKDDILRLKDYYRGL